MLVLSLAACDGSGGAASSADLVAGSKSPPTIGLSTNPTSVPSGGTTKLSWTTSNTDTCAASGGWTGNQPVNGSFRSGAISADTTFALTCNGPGGGAVARASVTVSSATSPSVQLSASPRGVAPGGTTTLTWSAMNVSSCTATGGWNGSKSMTGSETTSALNSDQTFQLSCTGSDGNALAITTVTIRTAVLTWAAPTQNVDGSALTDLSGYRVYWGNSSRSYSLNASISGAGATTYTTNLNPGTWYFAVSAVDGSGNESAKSNEVSKTVF